VLEAGWRARRNGATTNGSVGRPDPALPREMGSAEVKAFLSHLAVDLQVSASTQNQALAALLFLYREQLELELEGACGLGRGGGCRWWRNCSMAAGFG
ncbi:MAG: site-specific integrase, partial [Anderseniella sp.]|nr:site-specific integrase [Anderseniella sp.]